jgi:integration host factor subunit beta
LNALFGGILKKLSYPSEQMNRSDLIQLLADRLSQLTQKDAEAAVSTILDAMNSALVRGHRIEIRGFGSFTVIQRAPRLGRNPRNGAAVDIPKRRAPHFKVGKALREAVDSPTKMWIRASQNDGPQWSGS